MAGSSRRLSRPLAPWIAAAIALLGTTSCGGCVPCQSEDFTTTCRLMQMDPSHPDSTKSGWVAFAAHYERARGRDRGSLRAAVFVEVDAKNEQDLRVLLQRNPDVACSGRGAVRGTCSPGGITKVDAPRPSFDAPMSTSPE